MDLSVIVPCYNEEGNVREIADRLRAVFSRKNIDGEIVFVNDCSSDNTGALIDELAESEEPVIAVHHEVNRGLAAGWATGLEASCGEYVCLIDGDLQNLPEDVWRLYREITSNNVDIVQGYRSSVGRLKDSRYTLSKTLNFLLNTAFRMNLRDNKSGFITCRSPVLAEVLRRRFNYYHFQTFITVAAHARGFTIRQIETIFQSRLLGESFIPAFPLKLVFEVLTDLVKAVIEYRLSSKPRTVLAEYLADKPPSPRYRPMRGLRALWFTFYAWTMPLHGWLISRDIRTYYTELNRSQWLSPAEIRELQERKLRA